METPNPKTMERILREALAEQHLAISHSAALELVARQLGYSDWNVLAARRVTTVSKTGQTPPLPEADPVLPEGWFARGRLDLFRYTVLPGAGPEGMPAVIIGSRAPQEPVDVAKPGDFLTIMQRISATRYHGQSVSFRAQISCADADGSGRVWISAKGHGREPLAFDNLGLERGPAGPITGTTSWTQRSVTIEIPHAAVYINFGVLFGAGTGSFRAADFSFGLAAKDERPRELPDKPRNLDLGSIL